MAPRTVAALAVALASAVAGSSLGATARAADLPPAAQRLVAEWDAADDVAREVLVDAVAKEPDLESLPAFVDVAKATLARIDAAKARREPILARIAELRGAASKDAAKELADLRKELEAASDPRDARALDVLRGGVPGVFDGLPDSAFEARAPEAVRKALRGASADLRDWIASAVGGSRKERSGPFLVGLGVEAMQEHKKRLKERAGPAKKLEEVNAKISDALDRYLRDAYARGDFSGKVPVGLIGTLEAEKTILEAEVKKIQSAMDEASDRRLAARDALSRVVAGAEGPARERLLDLVERRVIGDADADVQAFGVGALGRTPGERAAGLLRVGLSNPEVRVVVGALDALGDREEPDAVDILRSKLYDARWPVRSAAAASLAKTGRGAAVPPLIEALESAKGRDLDDLRDALVRLTGRSYPAAPGPWKDWWSRAGPGWKGPKEAAAAAEAGAPPSGLADSDDGAVTFYGIHTHSTRVLFVLDVSGSMRFQGSDRDASRTKADVLREEVRRALTALPEGSSFDLIAFANGVRTWRKEAAVRSRATLNDALGWVAKLEVLGATNIYDALEAAFRLSGGAGRTGEPSFDTIFFVTDGKPSSGKVTDPRLILSDVRRWNEARKVRIHVVGVGGHSKDAAPGTPAADDIDVPFLKSLAEQNGGQCVIR